MTTQNITINSFALPVENGSPYCCSLEATIRLFRFGRKITSVEDCDVAALSVRCVPNDEVLPLNDMTEEQLDCLMLHINNEFKAGADQRQEDEDEKYCDDVEALFRMVSRYTKLNQFSSAAAIGAAIRALAGNDIIEAYLLTGDVDISLAARNA